MELVEIILLSTIGIVFLYFHCVCWKQCSFKRNPPTVRGSFIITKEENNVK